MADKNRLTNLRSTLVQYNQWQTKAVIPTMLTGCAERWRSYMKQRDEFNRLFQKMENSNAGYPLGYMTNYYFRNFEHPTTAFYDGLYEFDKQNYHLLTEQEMLDLEQKFKVDEIAAEVKRSIQEIRDHVNEVVATNAPIRRLKGMEGFYRELVAIRDDPWYYSEDLVSKMQPKGAYRCPEVHAALGLKMPFHRELHVKLEPMYETFDILKTKLKRLKSVLDSISSDLAFSDLQETTAGVPTIGTQVASKETGASIHPPKAFIAHGGKSGVLDKLREFIQALGIDPLIVELLPTKGMSVDDKVKKYIHEADCGIVLATRGGIIDKKSEKQHPRLNVIDEFERLRAVFPDKTILLLEKGVDLPSNIAGLTYEPFVRQSMDRAFTAIARELRDMKILKAVKPEKEE